MDKRFEKRAFRGAELRLSDGDGSSGPRLSGYIARFNSPSEDFGGWIEQIAPGAFKESIERDDIRALWNHNNDLVLGRTSAGTLKLTEDEIGLAFENTPPDTAWVKDRLVTLRRKDVTGSSFGFYTDADEWATKADGMRVRTLIKATLVEVSPGVTFPAYPQANTEAAQRSLDAWLKSKGPEQPSPDLVEFEMRSRRLQMQRLVL